MQQLQRKSSAAAYFLVDLSELSAETRQMIMEDAYAGGGDYGVTVVEEIHNGPARQPIFGVYFDTPETALEKQSERKWGETKATLGLSTATDAEADPEALRAKADAVATASAEATQAAEDAELRRITGEEAPANKAKR